MARPEPSAPAGPAVPMAGYPLEWESDVVLADGGTVRVRPIRPDDDDRLLRLYEQVSDETIYLRFFSPVSRPTARRLDRLTEVDHVDHVVLVAELGDDLVAVARYDRMARTDDAEVAFTVRDDQQGRGIGTIMLEHLAVIAREHGIGRFVATTLPQNRRMLDVFRDAGFEVTRSFAEGVVEVAFPIAPTPASLAAQWEREHRAEATSTARLLAPRSIAVVGANRERGTIGHEILWNLLSGDFNGPVYPVNPNAEFVASVRCFPTVLAVPGDVDLAIVAVPAPLVRGVVEQCAEKGVKGLVVITAGFAEVDPDGARAERELCAYARQHGMRMIGPNCMGVVNTAPEVRMNATFAPFVPAPGRVGFSTQSGALGIELLARARDLELGVSTFVSVGNKADVSGNDLLQLWEDDPNTDVILLYLESFGNPRKFSRLARRVSRRKPIVAVKSGRTGAGTRAAASHTAALAGPDVAVDALFRQTGVIRVDTLEQLFDTAQVLAHQPLPPGRRVAVVGNAGGPGILAADACESAGLAVPELRPETQAELRSFVARDASVRNPVDLVASATGPVYERALRTVLADEDVDAVLVSYVPALAHAGDDVVRAIVAAAAHADGKPVVACLLAQGALPRPLRSDDPGARPIPTFAFPEAAAGALGRAAEHADWRRRPEGTVPQLDGIDEAAARRIVDDQLAGHPEGRWLDQEVAVELCRCFGIPATPLRRVADADEAAEAAEALGGPVALKAGAAGIVHKSDVGGVRLGLTGAEEVRQAFVAMAAALGEDMGGALVQPMVEQGIETIVGVTHDPSFGPLVLFGMGGTAAELLRDTALRILPLRDLDAHELVRSLRSSPLLFGYRGSPATDVAALEDLLLRVGLLADALPEVAEMDANPVIASPSGVSVVDLKVRLARPRTGQPLGGLRRLRRS